jgi:hypothetical protein
MSEIDPTPNFGENIDANIDAMIDEVFKAIPGIDDEVRAFDAQWTIDQRTVERESKVINYLAAEIPEIADLQKMLISLYVISGVNFPTCEKALDVLNEMGDSEDYSQASDEFFINLVRLESFALLIQQIAGSEQRDIELSVDDILTEIVQGELFTPEERAALVDAVQLFMTS